MKKNKLISLALMTIIASNVWAEDERNCGTFHIQIANITSSPCYLTRTNVIHGNLQTPPPATIAPSFSKSFEITQTLRGPEIDLQYDCGGQQISFKSQQNLCFVAAGSIRGEVLFKTKDIDAFYTAETGSGYWDKPGIISWKITGK